MDDKTQKERLEQELRFLKESFEAEVISKEEFGKGKDRLEKKLNEIKQLEKEKAKEEPKKETQEQKKEQPKNDSIVSKEGEKIKLKVVQDEAEHHEHSEPVQIKALPAEKIAEKAAEGPKKEIAEEKREDKADSKFSRYAVIFIVLLLVAFFSYSFLKENKETQGKAEQVKFVSEPKESPKTSVVVLNDRKICFNCDTQRVFGILENWFGALNARELDYNTSEGRQLAEKFNPNLLPVYILDENIIKKSEFNKFRQTFVRKENNYILSDDAAGSTFYFKRDSIPNKLDFFVKSNDDASIKAERNIKEFLEAFKEVKFEKHLSGDKLAEELNIKTFPTFLVNNRVKFSGVHTAETIRNNFCRLNKLPECGKHLSKSLV